MAVFRVEKTKRFTVMSNHHLNNPNLSLKAKGLLSLMLSLPEDWDYTSKGLAQICREGVDAIQSALKELEECGYLTRRRLRDESGRITDIEYTIHEVPEETSEDWWESPEHTEPERDCPEPGNPVVADPVMDNPRQEKPRQQTTDTLNTNKPSTDQSIFPSGENRTDGMDGTDDAKAYRKLIRKNIGYDDLTRKYGNERVDEALELILEVVTGRKPYVRIAGDDFPREVVKSRFLKINAEHLAYVFDCMDQNPAKVGNIKAYLLTALYNAPATLTSYYRAEASHDLYGAV